MFCHYHGKWMECPMSGCRTPELAAGKIDDVMERVWNSCEASLAKCARDVHCEEKRKLLIADFTCARVHISTTIRLKFANWTLLPWPIAGVADVEP